MEKNAFKRKMIIQTLSKRGHQHENNEDALFYRILQNRFVISAVMDGCTSAIESQFASLLFKKVLSNSCQRLLSHHNSLEDLNLSMIGNEILHSFFTQIQLTQRLLSLSYDELASTLLLNVTDTNTKYTVTYCAGDGLIGIDGHWKKIDQNNVPDFLCYHLQHSFQNWFNHHIIHFTHHFKESVIISTDGIYSFKDKIDLATVNYEYISELCSSKEHYDDISMVFIQL